MKNFFSLVIMIIFLTSAVYSQNAWFMQYCCSNPIHSIYFVNNKTGWAAGEAGIVLKTTNSGINWISHNITDVDFHFIQFADINTGWVIANEVGTSAIYKTTNGGDNWIRQSSEIINYIRSAHFTDNNNGWAVGGNNIFKTSNGATSWNIMPHGFNLVTSVVSIYYCRI